MYCPVVALIALKEARKDIKFQKVCILISFFPINSSFPSLKKEKEKRKNFIEKTSIQKLSSVVQKVSINKSMIRVPECEILCTHNFSSRGRADAPRIQNLNNDYIFKNGKTSKVKK